MSLSSSLQNVNAPTFQCSLSSARTIFSPEDSVLRQSYWDLVFALICRTVNYNGVALCYHVRRAETPAACQTVSVYQNIQRISGCLKRKSSYHDSQDSV